MARPRDPSVEPRVMAAAISLLREGGYGAVTMEAVAHRAGVGKPTVYRRWSTRAQLVFELLNGAVEREVVPDTGSITGDLSAFVSVIGRVMATFDRSVVGDVVGELIVDAEFAEHVCSQRLMPDRSAAMEIWRRAVERGEVSADVDGVDVIDDLMGACFWRVYVLHLHVDRAKVASMVDRAVHGIASANEAQGTRAS